MKVFYIFGTAAAGVLGYFMEPGLRVQLTGNAPSNAELASNGKVVMQVDKETNLELEKLTPEQLPQRITINTDAKVSDTASGINMTIQAGAKVKLIRVEAGNAVISPGEGPFEGRIPVVETDLLQQLAANPPVIAAAKPAVETPAETTPAPVAETAPAPAGESAEPDMAATEPPPAPEPAPEAAPEPAPAPEPEVAAKPELPEPAPIGGGDTEAAPAGSDEVVSAMQASIKAAQIKEFTFDQVTEWKAGENETVDGESYQTGIASYSAETIFGNKVIQAKALVKGGKVARWIWPKSGMEIK